MTISALFSNYEQEAFRLETLPSYNVSQEKEVFTKFLTTGIIEQYDDLREYISDASKKIKEGKRHIRARVIPQPVTDYFIFESQIGYIPQSKVGFEIIFMVETDYKHLINKFFPSTEFTDFWLFDKKHLAKMEYDSTGAFLSINIIEDPNLINRAIQLRNHFIESGQSLSFVIDKYNLQKALDTSNA